MADKLRIKGAKVISIWRIVVLLLVSVLLSVIINRSWWLSPVSPCVATAGCISSEDMNDFKGKLTWQYWGSPVPYRETIKFEPVDKSRFAAAGPNDVASVSRVREVAIVLIDTAFWYALLVLLLDKLLPMLRRLPVA